jgi:hypothetical protein
MSETLRLWSATELIKMALGTSRPLVEWNVTTACETAFDKYKTLAAFVEDEDRAGAIKWLKDSRWTKSKEAAARGTEVHTAAENLALGAVVDVAPHIEPYVEQYRRMLEDFRPEFYAAEAPVYNVTAGYAGTLDAIAKIQGRTVVCDIKTTPYGPDAKTATGKPKSRPPYAEVALQLCLYRNAELVGLLADRREVNYRRYYQLDLEQMETHPMPETDGAVCIVVSPEDYMVVPVDTSERIWKACRHMLEVARFQSETSKAVFGPPISPQAQEVLA